VCAVLSYTCCLRPVPNCDLFSRVVSFISTMCVPRKEPDEEDTSKPDNGEKKDEPQSSGEQTILYPHEVKHHLRQLWDNDKDTLRHVLRAFAVNAGSMQYPVDIFFKQVQPVMPTRYRPVCAQCIVGVLSVKKLMNTFNVHPLHQKR